jgi:hypothetical protein
MTRVLQVTSPSQTAVGPWPHRTSVISQKAVRRRDEDKALLVRRPECGLASARSIRGESRCDTP